MSDVHVVFGAGQVGSTLLRQLVADGRSVRAVSRHRPLSVDDGVEWQVADVSNRAATVAAAQGASVVYQCLGVPYTKWPQLFPPLQRNVIAAAEATGALLVTLENVYGYGPTGGHPMTEDHPLAATSVKGRTRAAMTRDLLEAAQAGRIRSAIGRASDFFGAGVTQSALGERVFANALADKRADFIGNPDLAHTYSYVPDIAAGLAMLGTDERAIGEVWHLPGPETVTTTQLVEMVSREVGHRVALRSMPKLLLSALGLVNPMMRGLAEMRYQFDEPFVLDTSKFVSTFGAATTQSNTAVADTVAWFRTRIGQP
jgi:nucleoside-diphosphate-sugar epimerase